MGAFAFLFATEKECSEVLISGPRTIGNTGLEIPAQYETYCIDVPAADIGTVIFCISLIIIIEVILPFLNWIKNRK